jgi:hypothetical protein
VDSSREKKISIEIYFETKSFIAFADNFKVGAIRTKDPFIDGLRKSRIMGQS